MIINPNPIEIQDDKALHEALTTLFTGEIFLKSYDGPINPRIQYLRHFNAYNKYAPKTVVETGTYLGTGTTRQVIDAALEAEKRRGTKPTVYTIEASEKNCQIARNNLMVYRDWVKVLHGSSLDRDECIKFIREDEAIKKHKDYPEFYIDSEDPIPFYEKEVDGQLFGKGRRGANNLLADLIPRVYNKKPLFVLDSAGGIGFLEFKKINKMMQGFGFYVLLDDINHLKHFRSSAYIRHCKWPILAEDSRRWMLAYKRGVGGRFSLKKLAMEQAQLGIEL